jgi:hypothetical protein
MLMVSDDLGGDEQLRYRLQRGFSSVDDTAYSQETNGVKWLEKPTSRCLGRRGSGVQIAPPRPIESIKYGHF